MLERVNEMKNMCRSALARRAHATVRASLSAPLRCSAFFAACLSSIGYAGVVVVDASNGPGADFTQLAPAIAAASNGDTLLIRPGNYSGSFTIDGKSLDLVGEPNATVPAIGPLVVKNLAAGQRVLLQSLEFTAANSFMLPTKTLTASHCAGHLTIDRCRIALGSDDLVLDHCQEVVISRCEIVGADQFLAFFFEIPTGAGLRATSSRVAIHDSLVLGGNGSQGAEGFAFDELVPSGSGAPALRVSGGSELSIVGSQLQGGNGGDGVGRRRHGAPRSDRARAREHAPARRRGNGVERLSTTGSRRVAGEWNRDRKRRNRAARRSRCDPRFTDSRTTDDDAHAERPRR